MSPPSALLDALRQLSKGQDLSIAESEAAVGEILGGEAAGVVVAAFLTALRVKGETGDELAGAVKAVRSRAREKGLWLPGGKLDTCGTGGDGACSVNISTAAAIVAAAAGVPVVKHGNRSASGNSGSADVLAELGVDIEADTTVLNRCYEQLGVTFLFAPRFHPGLKAVAPIRKNLPFRTLFNLVGPLANPARPNLQLVGVASPADARLVADALALLGVESAAVVHGDDGTDEVSLSGPTSVLYVDHTGVSERTWTPEDLGLPRSKVEELRVSGPAESAARIHQVFAGEPGPARDWIVANAAAALRVADPEEDIESAVARASDMIRSGRAAQLLDRWRVMSQGAKGAGGSSP